MSTFNSVNLFGSGPHQIVVDGALVAKKRTGYAGCDGLESTTMGRRGRPIMIRGQLRAASMAALNALIEAIEDYCDDGGSYTLVDGFSESFGDVELDNIRLTSRIMYTGSTYIVTYECRAMQLFT